MKLAELSSAAMNNDSLRRVLYQIQNWMTEFEAQSGVTPFGPTTGRNTPPALSAFAVEGLNGQFVVTITDQSKANTGRLLNEVKSSETVPFVASTTILTHLAASPDDRLVINLPGATRYFQLRTRYSTSDFNAPQVFGPVDSGSLVASNLPVTLASLASVDPILIQPDVTPAIAVLATMFNNGTEQISYNAGVVPLTLDDQGDPLFFEVYYLYADDPNRTGGSVLYQATPNFGDVSAADGRVFFGAIDLRSNGGGVYLPLGVHGGPVVGTSITMQDGSTKFVEGLVIGDQVKGLDPANPEIVQDLPTAVANMPCFIVTTSTGRILTISSDHQLQLGFGGRVVAVDLVPGDSINTELGAEQIVTKDFGGLHTVYHIPLSRNGFHLGGGIWCG